MVNLYDPPKNFSSVQVIYVVGTTLALEQRTNWN
jgi:hypothetical protein